MTDAELALMKAAVASEERHRKLAEDIAHDVCCLIASINHVENETDRKAIQDYPVLDHLRMSLRDMVYRMGERCPY